MRGELLRVIAGPLVWLALCGGPCLLAGCDTVRDQTAVIEYVPTASSAAIPGAQNVTLSVVAADKRSGPKNQLSVKKGIVGAIVYTGNDPIEVIRSAIEREFRAQGFVIGSGGYTLTVEVENFYSDFRANGSMFMSANADVSLGVRVRDPGGLTRYRHVYNDVAQLGPIYNESAEKVKTTLEQALAGTVRQIADDKALHASLLASGTNPSPRSERKP